MTNQSKYFLISKRFNHRFSASLYTDESVDLQWSPQVTKYKMDVFWCKRSITKNTSLTRWQAVLDSSLLVSALFFSYIQLDFVFLYDPTKSYVLFFFIIQLNYHLESSLPSVCRSLAFLFLQWLSGVTLIGDVSYNLLVLFKMSCYT